MFYQRVWDVLQVCDPQQKCQLARQLFDDWLQQPCNLDDDTCRNP